MSPPALVVDEELDALVRLRVPLPPDKTSTALLSLFDWLFAEPACDVRLPYITPATVALLAWSASWFTDPLPLTPKFSVSLALASVPVTFPPVCVVSVVDLSTTVVVQTSGHDSL